MRIKINAVEFEVTPVPGALRTALLGDQLILGAILRDVYAWDAATQSGRPLVQLAQGRGVVLPNGISFFVPKAGPDGAIVKNEAPSKTMAQRFVKATGTKSMTDLMAALNRVVELQNKVLPLETFRPLNATASYRIRMFTDFAVLQLSNPARNLTGYLYLPSQVGFHAELGAIPNQAAHDAAVAAGLDVNQMRPGYIVPARTQAARDMRMAALSRAFEELQAEMNAAGGPEKATDIQKLRAARLMTEWKAIAPPVKAAS